MPRKPVRETEICQLLLAQGEMTAEDVRQGLQRPLSNSAVRSILNRLVAKGQVRRYAEGHRYIYAPVVRAPASFHALLQRVAREHFAGSISAAAEALQQAAREESLEREQPGCEYAGNSASQQEPQGGRRDHARFFA
jgi:predicted transcriptional regulator